MQVRICPKCKAENKFSNGTCSSCYASLEGALIKEVADPVVPPPQEEAQVAQPRPQTTPPQPGAPQMPRIGGPPPGQGAPANGPSPYGAPPSSVYSPPQRELQPVRQGPNVMAIILIVILVAGAGFGGWWFALRPKSPEQVVQAFIDAAEAGDVEKAKVCLAANSKDDLDKPGAADALKRNMGSGDEKDAAVKIGETTIQNDAKALVKLTPTKAANIPAGIDTSIDLAMVKEEGHWKIDLRETEKIMRQRIMQEMKKRGYRMPPNMK